MNKQRLEEAKRLAARVYQTHIFADETADGEPGFFAVVPEMPGCVSDGATIEEAKRNLESAKIDFIYFLLEDELNVPEPQVAGDPISIDMGEYLGAPGQIRNKETLPGARVVSS